MAPRKPRTPIPEQIKAVADRAEGIGIDDADMPNPVGRPTDYKPEYVDQVIKLCDLGATDVEIADFFGVTTVTLYRWSCKYPEFSNAKKVAKEIADHRVERSLYHRAIGYTFEAEEVFQYQGEVVRAKVRKHVPPDTGSMIFWLKNRRRDQWRDIQRIEHGEAGEFDRLADEEVMAEMRKEAAELGLSSGKPNGRGNGTSH